MDKGIKRIYQILIILGIAILFFIIAFSNPLIINNSDFSIYNSSWNGCSSIAIKTYKTGKFQPTFYIQENELTMVQRSFIEYNINSNESCIIIIGPRSDFSASEINYIKNFLKDGGILFLADDFGTGNQILKGINSSTRISNDLLLDLSFEKSARFSTIFNFANKTHPLFLNVTRILFNYPSFLEIGKDTKILAYSSELSWIDINNNFKHDSNEKRKSFPIIAIENYGKGKILILSDPSILINSMKEKLDNKNFINNLLKFLYEDRTTILIDESHRDISTAMKVSFSLPKTIGLEFKIIIISSLVILFLFYFTSIFQNIFKKKNHLIIKKSSNKNIEPEEELINKLVKKHPNWDKNKIKEIIREMN